MPVSFPSVASCSSSVPASPPPRPGTPAIRHHEGTRQLHGNLVRQGNGRYAVLFDTQKSGNFYTVHIDRKDQQAAARLPDRCPVTVHVDLANGQAHTSDGLRLDTAAFMSTPFMHGKFPEFCGQGSAGFAAFVQHYLPPSSATPHTRLDTTTGEQLRSRTRQPKQASATQLLSSLQQATGSPHGAHQGTIEWPDRSRYTRPLTLCGDGRATVALLGQEWPLRFDNARKTWRFAFLLDAGAYGGVRGGAPDWPATLRVPLPPAVIPGGRTMVNQHCTVQLPPAPPSTRQGASLCLVCAANPGGGMRTVRDGSRMLDYQAIVNVHGSRHVVNVQVRLDTQNRLQEIAVTGLPAGPLRDRYDWSSGSWDSSGKRPLSPSNEVPATSRLRITVPQRPPAVDAGAQGNIITRTTWPLRLENQNESAVRNGVGSTCAAHTVNQMLQMHAVSPAAMPSTTNSAIGNQITHLTGIDFATTSVHRRLYTGSSIGQQQVEQRYQAERTALINEFNRVGVAAVDLGRLYNANATQADTVVNHFLVLLRVADGQDEIDGGVWLLDSVMDAPIWFADADAAFTAIEQVNADARNEGEAFLQLGLPDRPLPPGPGASGMMVAGRGWVLANNFTALGIDPTVTARQQWNLDVSDLTARTPAGPRLGRGDPNRWIARWTQGPTPSSPALSAVSGTSSVRSSSPAASGRLGVNTVETHWLADYLTPVAALMPNQALLQTILDDLDHPPLHGALVNHYANKLRKYFHQRPRTPHFAPDQGEKLAHFAQRFVTHSGQDRLLLTHVDTRTDPPQDRTCLIVRQMDGRWIQLDAQGAPHGTPDTLQGMLGEALRHSGGDGLRLLCAEASDAEILHAALDPLESRHINIAVDKTPCEDLVDYLTRHGASLDRLSLDETWPHGPTDRDLEALLLGLIGRGAITDAPLIQDIRDHVRQARTERKAQEENLDNERMAWRQPTVPAQDDDDDGIDEDMTDAETSSQAQSPEDALLALHEEIDFGRRTTLKALLKRAADDSERVRKQAGVEIANAEGPRLFLNVNDLAQLLPPRVAERILEDAAKVKDAPVKRNTTARPDSYDAPKAKKKNLEKDPYANRICYSRALLRFAFQHSRPLRGQRRNDASYTTGARASETYRPRYALFRRIQDEYGTYLRSAKASIGKNKGQNISTAIINKHTTLCNQVLRRLEECTSPNAPCPLDADDALLRLNKDRTVLALINTAKNEVDQVHGILTWLGKNLDDVRQRQGTLPASARPRVPRSIELQIPQKNTKGMQPETEKMVKTAHEKLTALAARESGAAVDPGALQMQLKAYAWFLKWLEGHPVHFDDSMTEETVIPNRDLAEALPLLGGSPTGNFNDDRQTLARLAAQQPLVITPQMFPDLPPSLQNRVVNLALQEEKYTGTLRGAIRRIHDTALSGRNTSGALPQQAVHAELLKRFNASQHAEDALLRSTLRRWIDTVEMRHDRRKNLLGLAWQGTQPNHPAAVTWSELEAASDTKKHHKYEKKIKDLQSWLEEELPKLPDMAVTMDTEELRQAMLARLPAGHDRDLAEPLLLEWMQIEEAPDNLLNVYLDPVRGVLPGGADNQGRDAFIRRVQAKLQQRDATRVLSADEIRVLGLCYDLAPASLGGN